MTTSRVVPLRHIIACTCLIVFPLACGGPTSVPNAPEHFDFGTIEEVNTLYRSATSLKKSPPTSLKDLTARSALFGSAYQAIEKGDIVVYWGVDTGSAGQGAGGAEILAYKSDVPTNGGPVLLTDGTIKKISADEFKAAPKPAGKQSTDTK